MTEKYVRDGQVALLVSPGFGAGWSSWDHDDTRDIMRDRRLVEAMLEGGPSAVKAKADELWGDVAPYFGYRDLHIVWVPEGELFYLHEYDGHEFIVRENEMRRA